MCYLQNHPKQHDEQYQKNLKSAPSDFVMIGYNTASVVEHKGVGEFGGGGGGVEDQKFRLGLCFCLTCPVYSIPVIFFS